MNKREKKEATARILSQVARAKAGKGHAIVPPTRPHSTKHGEHGYNRKREKKLWKNNHAP